MFYPDSRLMTILGHYGSGKSELSINIALLLSAAFKPLLNDIRIIIADLDIVNPYFRSRERADFLLEKGIEMVSSAENFKGVDLPYMPSDLAAIFQDERIHGVIDAGGDPVGARVLARYADKIVESRSAVYFVVNANRPQTKTPDSTIHYLRDIESAAGFRVTGLINNTHLLAHTDAGDILRGAEVAREVSAKTGIPVVAHAVRNDLIDGVIGELDEAIIPMEIHLNKPWEKRR